MTQRSCSIVLAEPYRIFFLLGSLWGVLGVLLWPLYYEKILPYYPWIAHARIMIQGFTGAFVFGFLGTALPKTMEVPHLKKWHLITLITLHSASVIFQLSNRVLWGDFCFLVAITFFGSTMALRYFKHAQERLSSSWILALFGLLSAFLSTLLPILQSYKVSEFQVQLYNLLLYQGFLIYPFLGIGAYLFPKLLNLPSSQFRKSSVLKTLAYALTLTLSFLLEAGGEALLGITLRVVTLFTFWFKETHVFSMKRPSSPRGTLGNALYLTLAFTGIAYLLLPWYQPQRVAISHFLYIGGFGMLILIVASRVVLGHCGEIELFKQSKASLKWWIFLIVLAILTRVTPAWVPSTTVSHHNYAAITWAVVMMLWVGRHRRHFFKIDDSE